MRKASGLTFTQEVTTEEIIILNRLRWQIELVFIRLKSIIGIESLPNKSEKEKKGVANV